MAVVQQTAATKKSIVLFIIKLFCLDTIRVANIVTFFFIRCKTPHNYCIDKQSLTLAVKMS